MKLRLYHHPDGARIAYRETGTGPALALLHSLGETFTPGGLGGYRSVDTA